jgi:hypothetical protein
MRAVGIDDDGRVVIEPGGAALEEGCDDHHAGLRAGGRAQGLPCEGSGNGLRQVEEGRVLLLAEVGRAVHLGQAHNLRAQPGRAANEAATAARHMFSAGFAEQRIWINPTLVFMLRVTRDSRRPATGYYRLSAQDALSAVRLP